MKKTTPPILAALASLALAFSPVLLAQQSAGPDQSQNPRAGDSTADQHANTTGAPGQGNTLGKNDSKQGATETLDANPSTAPTGSDLQSATKTPSDATTGAGKDLTASGSAGDKAKDRLTDKDFVEKAAQGGMTEVQMGQVASQKGDSSQVKDFGARMVKDHTQVNDQLKDLAGKKGIALSPKLDSRHQAQVDRLSRLSGSAFDKAYMNSQVKAHESTVELFQQEAQSGTDPDIKAFANRVLPQLQDHLNSIKGMDNGQKK